MFAATASTILSGALAERVEFYSYLLYSMFLSGFLYPIITHWTWDDGWLADKDNVGVAFKVRYDTFS